MKGLHVCLFLLLLVPSIPHPLAKLLEPILGPEPVIQIGQTNDPALSRALLALGYRRHRGCPS